MKIKRRKKGPNSGETAHRDRAGRRGGYKTTKAKLQAEREAEIASLANERGALRSQEFPTPSQLERLSVLEARLAELGYAA
jgi:hypothetical protein